MLVIKRRSGESFVIDEVIKVKITSVRDGAVQIGISAPKQHNIRRSEVHYEKPDSDELPRPSLASPTDASFRVLDKLLREGAVISVRDNHFHLFSRSGSLLAHGADIEEMCASALQSEL